VIEKDNTILADIGFVCKEHLKKMSLSEHWVVFGEIKLSISKFYVDSRKTQVY